MPGIRERHPQESVIDITGRHSKVQFSSNSLVFVFAFTYIKPLVTITDSQVRLSPTPIFGSDNSHFPGNFDQNTIFSGKFVGFNGEFAGW